MIKLNISGKTWLDLGDGQKVECKTPNYLAMKAAGKHQDVLDEGVDDDGNPTSDAAIYVAYHLAQENITGWAGICDEDGNEVQFSPEAREAFAHDLTASTEFLTAYAKKMGVVGAEKNVSSPLLNGSTAGETTIAAAAETPATPAPE